MNNSNSIFRVSSWDNDLIIDIIITKIRYSFQVSSRRLGHTVVLIAIFIQIKISILLHTNYTKESTNDFGPNFNTIYQ